MTLYDVLITIPFWVSTLCMAFYFGYAKRDRELKPRSTESSKKRRSKNEKTNVSNDRYV